MKVWPALVLALLASNARAATAYVTDELVLGVYADTRTQGPRLATLHSGAAVETLGSDGESTQVRLVGGTVGWVKSVFLTKNEPASVRLKELQDELDRVRATTPALAEAAERSEVERLTRELAQRQSAPAVETRAPSIVAPHQEAPATPPRGPAVPSMAWWSCALLLALSAGYWLGHAVLARRIRVKFGGIKVY